MAATVRLEAAARRDLRRLDPGVARKQLAEALRDLGGLADTKPLRGAPGWLRGRVGDYRILYRPVTAAELPPAGGWLVARVVNRRDLDRAVDSLA